MPDERTVKGGCGYVFVALCRPRSIDVDFEVLIDCLAAFQGSCVGFGTIVDSLPHRHVRLGEGRWAAMTGMPRSLGTLCDRQPSPN